jgi:hypothetical protein
MPEQTSGSEIELNEWTFKIRIIKNKLLSRRPTESPLSKYGPLTS